MYKLYPASEKALNHKISTPLGPLPWPPRRSVDRMFPFQQMAVGECFRIDIRNTPAYDYRLLKERIARYNRIFKVRFFTVRFENGNIFEVARIA
jgi:hypothetical protein